MYTYMHTYKKSYTCGARLARTHDEYFDFHEPRNAVYVVSRCVETYVSCIHGSARKQSLHV